MAVPALPAHVNPNELIESAWGNGVVDYLDALPRGLLGYGQSVADQTGIVNGAGYVDITSLGIAAFTIPAGRLIRVECSIGLYKGASDLTSWATLVITKSDNTVLIGRNIYVEQNTYTSGSASAVLSTLAGTSGYKARLQSYLSYVNVSATANLAIYDVGKA